VENVDVKPAALTLGTPVEDDAGDVALLPDEVAAPVLLLQAHTRTSTPAASAAADNVVRMSKMSLLPRRQPRSNAASL
jgi:hypothetical protein